MSSKTAKKKLKTSQPTLKQRCGGKLVQPTLKHFFKKIPQHTEVIANTMKEEESSTNEASECSITLQPPTVVINSETDVLVSDVKCLVQSSGTLQNKPKNRNQCTKNYYLKDKPVKSQSFDRSRNVASIPTALPVERIESHSGTTVPLQRKSLSLRIRKRKHCIGSKESEPKKTCAEISTSKCKSTIVKNNLIPSEAISTVSGEVITHPKSKIVSISSSPEDELMKVYFTDATKCSEKIKIFGTSNHNVILPKEYDVAATTNPEPGLSSYPTFSPRKLTSSSVLFSNLEYDSHKNEMNLTPLQLDSSSLGYERKKSVKRALYPPGDDAVVAINQHEDSTGFYDSTGNNYSFGEDIDLSELLNCSGEVSHAEVNRTIYRPGINRYLVLEVVTKSGSEVIDAGRSKPELLLRLNDEKTKMEKLCYLRDDWFNTNVIPGDIVQINATFDLSKGCYIVDNVSDTSIIVHPDTLISGTSVANSITCTRKSVLAEKFKGNSTENEAMILGQLLHKIFQATLIKYQQMDVALGDVSLGDIIKMEVKKIITSLESLDHLYTLGMSEVVAMELLSGHIPAIEEWCRRFMHSEPHHEMGNIDFKRLGNDTSESCVCVTDVVDIEESIWSPRFGLKGKVDVTVNIKERRGKAVHSKVEVTPRVPLELKTGKMYHKQGTIEHRAQVVLYSLMLSDRYSCHPTGGLLVYLKGNHMHGIPLYPHEKRGLLMARNHLSRYYGNQSGFMTLPGMLKDQHTCKHCPYLKQCTFYHCAIEDGNQASSGLGELFSTLMSSITSSRLKFFSQWFWLLAEEERYCGSKRETAPWLSTACDREQEGLGFADMLAHSPTPSGTMGKCSQYFTKQGASAATSTVTRLISVNDRVIVSRQDATGWALAMGTIACIMPGPEVQVILDKLVPYTGDVLYRIDKVPGYNEKISFMNMVDLCASNSLRDQHLRELIIDNSTPRFVGEVSVPASYKHLNCEQREAIKKVLSAQDYALILGMPGTGKTTTIAYLVQVLVASGKSVLLTSYTHSAVDNILLKLKKDGLPFLRLGSPSRVHPDLRTATPLHMCQEIETVKDLEDFYHSQPVVATTCLGITHPIFTRRTFDVCIIDEASQITLPVCIGPLKYAKVFVLVGDHYQLPPLVLSQEAREGGLDVSLFRYLSERHPSALILLEKQYRMNREIMNVANHLIYNNQLECGSEEVARGHLCLPLFPSFHISEGWMEKVLNPQLPVLFLDTDQHCDAMETITGELICNRFEANLVAKIVLNLIKCGLACEKIGVITPLRHQQILIQEKIHTFITSFHKISSSKEKSMNAVVNDTPLVEVNTVDKYQGRDKDCIIVSFVRSNSKGNSGVLLHDWRRINVAITRAKHKLLLIGSFSTLCSVPILQSLLNFLSKGNQILPIPPSYNNET